MKDLKPSPLTPFDQRVSELSKTIEGAQRTLFDAVMGRVDVAALATLQDEFAQQVSENAYHGFTKYIDLPFWVADKIARASALGLNKRAPSRLLDLGTGAGHFLAACGAMGHECVGLDVEMPLCERIADILGVDRRTLPIQPRTELPATLGKFDIATGFAIKFDALGRNAQGDYLYWSHADWDFFLRDLTGNRMNNPGLVYFQLNQRVLPNGSRELFHDIVDQFESIGAEVKRSKSEIRLETIGETRFEVGQDSVDA